MTDSAENVLEVRNLQLEFSSDGKTVPVLRGLSYVLPKGKVIGVVGESGSGKTVHARRRISAAEKFCTGAKIWLRSRARNCAKSVAIKFL